MLNIRTTTAILSIVVFGWTAAQSQSTTMAAMPVIATAHAVAAADDARADADYLPYAEPILGIEKDAYEEHFNEYREGALMDRILDLENMELQAIYTDSKLNEINVAFNSSIEQEVVLAVYDSFGQKVMLETHMIKNGINNYTVQTEQLDEGFYSMVVTGQNDQFIQRFIIE